MDYIASLSPPRGFLLVGCVRFLLARQTNRIGINQQWSLERNNPLCYDLGMAAVC
jgi:hypothetical protein